MSFLSLGSLSSSFEDYGQKVSVVSYNILSRTFSTPNSFPETLYKREHLESKYRFARICEKLNEFIAMNFIICLQEVDIETEKELRVFFEQQNYLMEFSSFGNEINGFVGVAIAYPLHLKVLDVKYIPLNKCKEWPEPKKDSIFIRTLKKLSFGYIDFTRKYPIWEKMRTRKNILLVLEFSNFWIATFYAPREFTSEQRMLVYIALVREKLESIVNEGRENKKYKPCILAGDFNLTPNSQIYSYLTSGSIEKIKDLTKSLDNIFPQTDTWRPKNLDPLFSAVRERWGVEPKWTNKVFFRLAEDKPAKHFEATIDYILVSPELRVVDSFRQPSNDNVCPNENEGSNHIAIWTKLSL